MNELERIRSTIGRVSELPTLPDLYQRFSEVVERPNVSSRDVQEIISEDPALTGKVLRLVNSAFFGLSTEITSIQRAVAVLGFNTLRQLVLTTTVLDMFKGIDSGSFDPKKVWEHSLATALGAQSLGRIVASAQCDEWFVAGLLHDIGILFQLKYLPQEFSDVLLRIEQENVRLIEAEALVIGQTHTQIGALLLRHWRLPLRLTTVAAYHHCQALSRVYAKDLAAVAVADMLSLACGWGFCGDDKVERISKASWECLGISTPELDLVAHDIEQGMVELSTLLEEQSAVCA